LSFFYGVFNGRERFDWFLDRCGTAPSDIDRQGLFEALNNCDGGIFFGYLSFDTTIQKMRKVRSNVLGIAINLLGPFQKIEPKHMVALYRFTSDMNATERKHVACPLNLDPL
jgi:hypothetical protein